MDERPAVTTPGSLPRLLEDVVAAGTPAQWRLLAWLWALGGGVALLAAGLGAGPRADPLAVAAVAVAALAAAGTVAALAERLPARLLGPVLVAGTTSVSLATVAAGAADAPFVCFYAWVGAEAWYFLSYRGALLYTAYGVALSGVMALVLPAAGGSGLTWWLVTTASLLVIGTMAAALRIRSDRAVAHLRAQAERDELTGVLNRRGLAARAAAALAAHRRTGAPLAVVLADLDHFKRVNDRWGHAAGDDLLRRFTAACDAELRGTDAIGRVGGEEFALLLPGSDAAAAAAVAGRVRARMARELTGPDRAAITASFGVAAVPDDARDGEALLAVADRRLYEAKRRGRDRVETR